MESNKNVLQCPKCNSITMFVENSNGNVQPATKPIEEEDTVYCYYCDFCVTGKEWLTKYNRRNYV